MDGCVAESPELQTQKPDYNQIITQVKLKSHTSASRKKLGKQGFSVELEITVLNQVLECFKNSRQCLTGDQHRSSSHISEFRT